MPLFNAPKKHVLKLFYVCVVSRSPAPDKHRLRLFATTLICAALGILHWSGRYVNEMLRLCSLICALSVNHPAEISMPIGVVLEMRSHANLSCLVNQALTVIHRLVNLYRCII